MSANGYVDDVSALNLNTLEDGVDYDQEYAPAQTAKPLPPPGSYFLRLPSKIQFGKTPKGALSLILNGTKIEDAQKPEADGYEIRFLDVNTGKVFGQNASSANDLLDNIGVVAKPTTAEDWQNIVRTELEGQVTRFPVYLTWQGYDKRGTSPAEKYVKLKTFPEGADGTRESKLIRQDSDGKDYVVFANLKASARGFAPPKEA